MLNLLTVIIIIVIIANTKKTMNYVTIKNGVVSPIERKQLYYISKPPLVIINETNNIEDVIINKTIHIDGYTLEQVKKYKYLHIKLVAYSNTIIADNLATLYKDNHKIASINFLLQDYRNYLEYVFSNNKDMTDGGTCIIENTFTKINNSYVDINNSWDTTEQFIEELIRTGDFKFMGYTQNNIKAGFSTFQIYFSNNINPTY